MGPPTEKERHPMPMAPTASSNSPRRASTGWLLLCLAAAPLLSSCGSSESTTESTGYKAGVFAPASTFVAKCQAPRSGTDPSTGKAFPDKPGTANDEKAFLRSWTNDFYLWYREVPDRDWGAVAKPIDYFDLLKTSATTTSGKAKDQFHFTYDTDAWVALSQSGVEVGYGIQWVIQGTPPRSAIVAYTEPGSPAPADLKRGASVVTIDGVDVANGSDTNTLNAGLYPSKAGETHTFAVLDLGATSPRTITLTAAVVTSTPVQNAGIVSGTGGQVGYMLFNDHIATAEVGLIDAINQLKASNVSDLVLDIRYNGGGYLDIASELAYMIAGPGPTAGKTFERTMFNDKYATTNPITGGALTPVAFHDKAEGFSAPAGQALPFLGLSRVFVLTSANTCSASEAVINGLRGVDVQVIQVGSTTCGKPYGFYPQDNCGTTYFSVQFQGVNQKGFGDYADGFVPAGTAATGLPGCQVADDLFHALGDPQEARLAAALHYRSSQTCPGASGAVAADGTSGTVAREGRTFKSPWRENRILSR